MAFKHLMITLCALAMSSLTSVNGKYRISWITSDETGSGTHFWVGFEAFKADGKTKTKWMKPNSNFDRGYYGSAEVNEPSIGDIAKVNVHVEETLLHQDDWRGYQVVISDYETKKTYEFFPGHVDTGAYQKYNVREIKCEDKASNVQMYCNPKGKHCGTSSNPSSAFNMAKFDFKKCLKICNFCYPPNSDEPEDEEAREDEEPTDDDSSADHEKKSTSHHKKN